MSQIIRMFGEEPLLRCYFFYCSLLVVKMMFMSSFTGFKRMFYGIFMNPEDIIVHRAKVSTSEKVERVRRAHLNDVENIPLFFCIAFIYCLTNPSLAWANSLFKVFTLSRFVHTLVYAIVPFPQPSRMIAWIVGYLIIGYMALSSIMFFMN